MRASSHTRWQVLLPAPAPHHSECLTGERQLTYAQMLKEYWTARSGMSQQDRTWFFKFFWRIGDPLPIAGWLGVEYVPPTIPDDMDLDDQLAVTIDHAREWIVGVYRRLYEPVNA